MRDLKKIDAVKIIGLAGMALGGLATLIGNWAQQRTMEQTIEEKIEEALATREENEEF